MDIIKWMLVMAMCVCFKNGVHTDVIPYETQKEFIEQYIFEIIEEGQYEINPAFILAIVETESTYYWDAQNGEHYGLMQINPKWQKDRMEKLGVEDLAANPYDNLRVGIDYICELLDQYKDPFDALTVYNSGSTNGIASQYSIGVMKKYYDLEEYIWDKYEGW